MQVIREDMIGLLNAKKPKINAGIWKEKRNVIDLVTLFQVGVSKEDLTQPDLGAG